MKLTETRIAADLQDLAQLTGVETTYEPFSNGVFEIRPYCWDDCDRGFEALEWSWSEDNTHHFDCFHERRRRALGNSLVACSPGQKIADEPFVAEFGGHHGIALHCDCGHREQWSAWRAVNGHADNCTPLLPNFLYYAGGLRIDWYKHIGRSLVYDESLTWGAWHLAMRECFASVLGIEV